MARRPFLALWSFALLAVGVAILLRHALETSPPRPAEDPLAAVATSRLPEPTQVVPGLRVDALSRALATLSAACDAADPRWPASRVRDALGVVTQLSTDYPGGGFRVGGVATSTPAVLVAVRAQLQDCDPADVPVIDAVLPAQFRP
ncbi:hypothetical protein [Nocardioides phosphati]|uniref:hypothetical protein n=1 Tax=Nocardioides phosphati TaxID=1867775 RepID=UPI001663427E|nr:hypothetical protein [Nocardioides phosphati]